jgi:hypothetical protein
MVTTFSATEARQQVLDFKKKTESKAKARAQIILGWGNQRGLLIDAAVEGCNRLILKPPIFKYQDLIYLNFNVIERGWVKNQNFESKWLEFTQENESRFEELALNDQDYQQAEKLKKINEKLNLFREKFLTFSYKDVQQYYGFSEFTRIVKGEMLKAKESNSSFFHQDHAMWANVPEVQKFKFAKYFSDFNQLIKAYKKFKKDYLEIKGPAKFIEGDYFYSYEDKKAEVISGPALYRDERAAANIFLVSWEFYLVGFKKFFNGTLFSARGLAWLSMFSGQLLLESVFGVLENTSVKGHSERVLNFRYSTLEEGWSFERDSNIFVNSCNPIDLVEIIERKGFVVDSTNTTNDSFTISVTW